MRVGRKQAGQPRSQFDKSGWPTFAFSSPLPTSYSPSPPSAQRREAFLQRIQYLEERCASYFRACVRRRYSALRQNPHPLPEDVDIVHDRVCEATRGMDGGGQACRQGLQGMSPSRPRCDHGTGERPGENVRVVRNDTGDAVYSWNLSSRSLELDQGPQSPTSLSGLLRKALK